MTRKEFSNVGSPLVLFLSCMLIYSWSREQATGTHCTGG
jgi:hypothetical protein